MKKIISFALLALVATACTGHMSCGLFSDAKVGCMDKSVDLNADLGLKYDCEMKKAQE